MKPERRTFPINRGENFANRLFDTGLPDAPNRKASYPSRLDVAIGVVRIKFIALANLRDVPVLDQRRAVPDCQEGFAPSGGEREIHAGCRTQPSFCIIVPRMEEIAVAIDVHEPQPTGRAGAGETAQNNAAVSPNNHGERLVGDRRLDFERKLLVECSERGPIPDPGGWHCIRLVVWSRQADRRSSPHGGCDTRCFKHLGSAPGTGDVGITQRAQPKIAWCGNKGGFRRCASVGFF